MNIQPQQIDSWRSMIHEANAPKGFFAKMKSFFITDKVPVERLRDATDCFKVFIQDSLKEISCQPPYGLKPDSTSVESIFDVIAERSIGRILVQNSHIRRDDFNSALLNVDKIANSALSLLKLGKEECTPDMAIQVVFNPRGGFNVIRKVPPVESMVFQGGGAKGAMYSEALMALALAGKLPAQACIGTSAGAVTAAFLASGLAPHKIAGLLETEPMTAYLRTDSNFSSHYPHAKLGNQRIGYNAGNAIKIVDIAISRSVQDHLNVCWDTAPFKQRFNKLEDPEKDRLTQLREQKFDGGREGKMLTFKDLALLNSLSPGQFRKLTVTAWNRATNTVAYLNATTTPDLEVAFAVRASMSIPQVFVPIQLTVGTNSAYYSDGGQGSNLPTEAVLDGAASIENARASMLAFQFDDNGAGHKILHSPMEEWPTLSKLYKWALGQQYVDVCRQDAQKAYDQSSNVFNLQHGTLGTLDFDVNSDTLSEARVVAWGGMVQHLENTKLQAYGIECKDAEECYRQLTIEEKRYLLRPLGELPKRASRAELLERHFYKNLVHLAESDPELKIDGSVAISRNDNPRHA